MNQLEQKTINTLEVAEMMDIKHYQVLEKLEGTKTTKGIIPTMRNHKIVVADYFQESTYQDAQDKPRKCYLVTKLGCDFLANKFTGEKGILFTAKYVKKFAEMEKTLKKPLSALDQLKLVSKATIEVNEKIDAVDKKLEEFKHNMPILGVDCDRITSAARKVGVRCLGGKASDAYNDNSVRGKVYKDIYNELNRQFGTDRYKELKRSQLDQALAIINNYQLPLALAQEIININNQINLDVSA